MRMEIVGIAVIDRLTRLRRKRIETLPLIMHQALQQVFILFRRHKTKLLSQLPGDMPSHQRKRLKQSIPAEAHIDQIRKL